MQMYLRIIFAEYVTFHMIKVRFGCSSCDIRNGTRKDEDADTNWLVRAPGFVYFSETDILAQ